MKKIPMIILSVATAGCIAAGTAAVLSEKQTANVEQGGNSGHLAPAKKDISSLIVNTIADQIYTGQAITPAVIILDGQTQLVQDKDYTLQYADNIHVGTAHITITGTGKYTGTATINFGIVAPFEGVLDYEFKDNTITSYTGTDAEVMIPASYSLGKSITQSESVVFEYQSSGEENKNEGTADGGHSLYNDVKSWLQAKFPLTEDKLNTMTSAIVYGNTSGDRSYFTYSINNTNGTHYDISVTYTYQQYVAGNDYQVTAIGNRAFWGRSITSVSFPASINTIGNQAFEQSQLTAITLPSTITTLGDNAFANIPNLASVTIEGDLDSIGSWVFNNCNNLTSISITHLTKLGYGMFAGATNLQSVTLPSGLTEIAVSAFSRSGLTNVTIPASVVTIGSEAFGNCNNLTSVIFDGNSSITTIGAGAFMDCTSLGSVTLPASVTSVENFAFQNCNNLTTLKLSSLSMVTLGGMIVSDGTTIKVPQILLSSYQNTYPDYNFEREPAYDVTYQIKYINDGQSFQTSSSLNGDMTYCWASDPSKEGYTFLGWSTIENDSNYIVDKSTWTPTADTTLYAIYQVNNT